MVTNMTNQQTVIEVWKDKRFMELNGEVQRLSVKEGLLFDRYMARIKKSDRVGAIAAWSEQRIAVDELIQAQQQFKDYLASSYARNTVAEQLVKEAEDHIKWIDLRVPASEPDASKVIDIFLSGK